MIIMVVYNLLYYIPFDFFGATKLLYINVELIFHGNGQSQKPIDQVCTEVDPDFAG